MSSIDKPMKTDVNKRTPLQAFDPTADEFVVLDVEDVSLKPLLEQLKGEGDVVIPVQVTGGVTIDGDTTLAGTVILRDGTDSEKKAVVADGALKVDLATNAQIAGLDDSMTEVIETLDAIIDGSEPVCVKIASSRLDLRGLADDRPAATMDNVGVTYWSVDTGEVSVSTGVAWRVLGVA